MKNISHVDTSRFALKSNLVSLKTQVDKLNIDKFAPVLVGLSKQSDVVKHYVVKETSYDKLIAKLNSMDTSRFVLKTKYNSDKSELEKNILDTSGLVRKADYNAKITEIVGKIPKISVSTTTSALTTFENNIPNISSLVKKEITTQTLKKLKGNLMIMIITTPEFNNVAPGVSDARSKQANLVTKTDFDTKLRSLNQKINSNKTKHLLVKNELKKAENIWFGLF